MRQVFLASMLERNFLNQFGAVFHLRCSFAFGSISFFLFAGVHRSFSFAEFARRRSFSRTRGFLRDFCFVLAAGVRDSSFSLFFFVDFALWVCSITLLVVVPASSLSATITKDSLGSEKRWRRNFYGFLRVSATAAFPRVAFLLKYWSGSRALWGSILIYERSIVMQRLRKFMNPISIFHVKLWIGTRFTGRIN